MAELIDDESNTLFLCFIFILYFLCESFQDDIHNERQMVNKLRRRKSMPMYKRRRKKTNLDEDRDDTFNPIPSLSIDNLKTSDTNDDISKSDCPILKTKIQQQKAFQLLIALISLLSSHNNKQNCKSDSQKYQPDECTKDCDSEQKMTSTDDKTNTADEAYFLRKPIKPGNLTIKDSNENLNGESKLYRRRKKKHFINNLTDVVGWHFDTYTQCIVLPILRLHWDYSRYLHRLGSFWCFPRNVDVLGLTFRLARSGFYYTGQGRTNVVRCFYCNLETDWNEADEPDTKHHELSPSCSRFQNHDSNTRHNVVQNTIVFPFRFSSFDCNGNSPVWCSDADAKPLRQSESTAGHQPEKQTSSSQKLEDGDVNQTSGNELVHLKNGKRTRGNLEQSASFDLQENQESPSLGAVGGGSMSQRCKSDRQLTHEDDIESEITGRRELNHGSSSHRGTLQPLVRISISLRQQRRTIDREALKNPETVRHQRGTLFRYTPLGICREQPRHRNFAKLKLRYRTFNESFPKHQSPFQLSRAGFFYTGTNDNVECFFCGGGLRNWAQGDDPWVRHAQWFPHCAYLQMVKGEAYVLRVSNLFSEN